MLINALRTIVKELKKMKILYIEMKRYSFLTFRKSTTHF